MIKKIIKVFLNSKAQCPKCKGFNTTYLHAAGKNFCLDCNEPF
jgi:hypothetical protein